MPTKSNFYLADLWQDSARMWQKKLICVKCNCADENFNQTILLVFL